LFHEPISWRRVRRAARTGDEPDALRIGSTQLSGTLSEHMSQIRPPHFHELERLREIERDAGHAFADIGMPEIANDEPLSVLSSSSSWRLNGRGWRPTPTTYQSHIC
jgi:hypothetical protein